MLLEKKDEEQKVLKQEDLPVGCDDTVDADIGKTPFSLNFCNEKVDKLFNVSLSKLKDQKDLVRSQY